MSERKKIYIAGKITGFERMVDMAKFYKYNDWKGKPLSYEVMRIEGITNYDLARYEVF